MVEWKLLNNEGNENSRDMKMKNKVLTRIHLRGVSLRSRPYKITRACSMETELLNAVNLRKHLTRAPMLVDV